MSSETTGRPGPAAGIKSLDAVGIARTLAEWGQPRFRADQVVRWVYGGNISSYDEMTNVPVSLRDRLSKELPLTSPEIIQRQDSSDGTRKYLLRLADGVSVECVGLPTDDRLTVCFSTQAGCGMGCAFCATGASGLTRDLGPGEMVDQVRLVGEDFCRRVSNAVAMGQGEPFANYDAVLGGLRLMNAREVLGIGARHLTVSTCGLVAGIRRFSLEPEQFTLAVSLHSAVQATRDQLMPGVRGVKLSALRKALVDYGKDTGRRPSLEYALIDGVNDTDEELNALVEFSRGMLVHINLIPVNPVAGSAYLRANNGRVHAFLGALQGAGIEASIRAERGTDIDAACGQLSQKASG